MSLRINTNVASIGILRQMGESERSLEGALKSLASGKRFDDPAEKGADFSISENLRGQIAGLKAGQRNAEGAQSFIQVGESGLNEQNNILVRMRELAVQAASDTVSDKERDFIQTEFSQLQQEVDRIALTTQYGSHKILAGSSKEYEFQVGPDKGTDYSVKFKQNASTRSSELGIDSLSVEEKSEALDSLEGIDKGLEKIAEVRSQLAAMDSRLSATIQHSGSMIESVSAAHSHMADTDIGNATSKMYKNQVLQQYQMAVLNESNRQPGNVLKLIA